MIQLSEIDGTVLGRATLVLLDQNHPDGEIVRMDFSESESPDPLTKCRKVRVQVAEEFPHLTTGILANPRARYLEWRAAMVRYGHNLLTPEHFLQGQPRRMIDIRDFSALVD